ncbi:putative quinol monooxygenase [Oryzobacter telluris]|uniref:putative quinol monooxygenase n=1 Tax=Oryzobacter telluris TaxID=3149179 RepID=UPI00370D8B4E
MSDLPVVAVIVAKPGSEDTVRSALQGLVEPTLAESGCRAYSLHESVAEPGTFVTIESWDGSADLDQHMASDHIAAALAATDGHLASPPSIHPLSPAS